MILSKKNWKGIKALFYVSALIQLRHTAPQNLYIQGFIGTDLVYPNYEEWIKGYSRGCSERN